MVLEYSKKFRFKLFDNYEKINKEKLQLFASLAYGKVLDIECSEYPNIFLDHNEKVSEVYLLDIVEPKRKIPKKTVKFIKFDLNQISGSKLPFSDDFFDTVIIGDVIEHLFYPILLLREINRILKLGGLCLLSVPSSRYWLEILNNLIFGKPIGFPEHKLLFTRKQMLFFLNSQGFEVEKVIGYSFIFPLTRTKYIGFINTKFRLPEIITWQQIYICKKLHHIE